MPHDEETPLLQISPAISDSNEISQPKSFSCDDRDAPHPSNTSLQNSSISSSDDDEQQSNQDQYSHPQYGLAMNPPEIQVPIKTESEDNRRSKSSKSLYATLMSFWKRLDRGFQRWTLLPSLKRFCNDCTEHFWAPSWGSVVVLYRSYSHLMSYNAYSSPPACSCSTLE